MSITLEFTNEKDEAMNGVFESINCGGNQEDDLENFELKPNNSFTVDDTDEEKKFAHVNDEAIRGITDIVRNQSNRENNLDNIKHELTLNEETGKMELVPVKNEPVEIYQEDILDNTKLETLKESHINDHSEIMIKLGFAQLTSEVNNANIESDINEDEEDAENIEMETSKVPEPECLLECEDEDEDMSQESPGEGCSTDKLTEKLYLTSDEKTLLNNNLSCDICAYYTTRADHMRRHMFRHKEKQDLKLFKCDSCDYQSPRKDHLKKHSVKHKAEHEIEKLQCPYCHYQIVRTDHMKNHIVKKHKDQLKMLECQICSFQTPHEDVLERHSLRHAFNKKKSHFECEAKGCVYSTTVRSYLTRHVRTKHGNSEPFKCSSPGCEYKTPRKDKLKVHFARHHGSSGLKTK